MSTLKIKKVKLSESASSKSVPKKRRVSRAKLSEKTALFISDANGFYTVSLEFLRSLNYEQAMALGRDTLTELRIMMIDDVMSNTESSIENIKVTTGLNNTLDQLHTLHPNILKQIHASEPSQSSIKVFFC